MADLIIPFREMSGREGKMYIKWKKDDTQEIKFNWSINSSPCC